MNLIQSSSSHRRIGVVNPGRLVSLRTTPPIMIQRDLLVKTIADTRASLILPAQSVLGGDAGSA
jgi:hypothetical protein